MALLFSILKVIGMTLLVIAVILIIIIACLLFVPVCYEAKGDISAGDYQVRIHWFLRAFQFLFYRRDGTNEMELRIFWRRSHLLDTEYRENRKRKKAARREKKQLQKKQKKKNRFLKKREKLQKKTDLEAETITQKEISSDKKISAESCNQNTGSIETDKSVDASLDKETEKAKTDSFEKVRDIFRKVKKVWTLMQTWHPLQMIWPLLQKLLYRIRPVTLQTDLIYGFTDPSVTGKILGAVSNLYFIYYYDTFHLQGDFEAEETYIDGTFLIRGKIRGIYLLIFVISILSKKEFRKFLGAIKKAKMEGTNL